MSERIRRPIAVALLSFFLLLTACSAPSAPLTGNEDSPAPSPSAAADAGTAAGAAATAEAVAFAAPQAIGRIARHAQDPFLRVAGNRVWLSYTETAGSGRNMYLMSSIDGGLTFGAAVQVNDQVGELSGHGGENLAKFAVDDGGGVYSVWMQPLGQTRSGDARLAYSRDGRSFGSALTINDDGKEVNHAFISIAASGERALAAWIDGRDRVEPGDWQGNSIYAAVAAKGEVGANIKIGDSACPCCRTGIAFADGGQTVYISYRRAYEEDLRNFAVVRSDDGGHSFGEPILVSDDGWRYAGCPHTGAALAADDAGRLHVLWYTAGAGPEESGVYYSVSTDRAETFAPRRLLDLAGGPAVLHPQLAAGPGEMLYAIWTNIADGEKQIFFAHSADGGQSFTAPQRLSAPGVEAGYPVIAVSGNTIYTAWTELVEGDNPGSRVVLRIGRAPGQEVAAR